MPSDSVASLTSFGIASPLTSFGTALRDVIPKHASAEGPLAYARGDKKGLGAKKKLGMTAGGSTQKHF